MPLPEPRLKNTDVMPFRSGFIHEGHKTATYYYYYKYARCKTDFTARVTHWLKSLFHFLTFFFTLCKHPDETATVKPQQDHPSCSTRPLTAETSFIYRVVQKVSHLSFVITSSNLTALSEFWLVTFVLAYNRKQLKCLTNFIRKWVSEQFLYGTSRRASPHNIRQNRWHSTRSWSGDRQWTNDVWSRHCRLSLGFLSTSSTTYDCTFCLMMPLRR